MHNKLKLLRTNAAVWFNKMCKIKHLKPNYLNIKVNGNKSQDKKTTTNAIKYRKKCASVGEKTLTVLKRIM